MDPHRETDEFRRIHLEAKIERAEGLTADYRNGIDFFRERIDNYKELLGHIAERLGEPEPKELR